MSSDFDLNVALRAIAEDSVKATDQLEAGL